MSGLAVLAETLFPSPFQIQMVQEEQQQGKRLHALPWPSDHKVRARRKRQRQNRRDGRRQARRGTW